MYCGCKIISDNIRLEKTFYREDGLTSHRASMCHNFQQYVELCGNCIVKARHFNVLENSKLNIAKEQLNVLTGENLEELEPEPETNPEH